MNIVDIITTIWAVAQYVLVIACLGAAVFGTLLFLTLPFIALVKDDKER